jgi:hypothetical protein
MVDSRCWLLLLWAITTSAFDAAAAGEQRGTTAFVSQPLRDNTTTTLAAALEDQHVTRIVLLTSYALDKDAWARQQQRTGTYLSINR